MKHLLILPGNSVQNRAWGERMASHYSSYFDTFHVAEYAHWKEENSKLDLVVEIEALRTHMETVPKGAHLYVLAKSMGSILAFKAVEAGVMIPSYTVFFGIPFDLAAGDALKESWSPVSNFSGSAIAFHNAHDPVAEYDFTKQILDRHAPNISLITLSGEDHRYDDYKTYDSYLLTVFAR